MKRNLLIIFMFLSIIAFGQNTSVIDIDGTESFFVRDDGSNNLDLTGSYTFETWLYLKSFQAFDRIMDRRTVMDFEIIAPYGAGDYGIKFVERYSDDTSVRYIETDASEDLYLNRWYHIAVTFDGSTCLLYVNGNVVGVYNSTLWNLTSSTNPINFGGRYWGSYGYQIDGYMDEIRVSDIARTASEMHSSLIDAPYTSDANTVLLMHLDDDGNSPTYVSGNGLTGTTGDDDIDAIRDYFDKNHDFYTGQ